MSKQLKMAALRLENWIKNDAIPLWQTKGINSNHHGHYERLLANGDVDLESNVRVRVQARQAFFFTVAASRGWCDQGQIIAQNLLTFVKKNAAHPSAKAGYTHLMDKHFKVVDTKQDIYDHAFFILANAWIYRATGDEAALVEAEKIVSHLDTQFGSPCGGWIEGDYEYSHRRQNPHMHLFEAFLALYEATGDAKWLARVGELFALFQTRFFDANQGVLFEFFGKDWSRLNDAKKEDAAKREVVEPGHMMEWVWLLDWYSRCSRCSGRPVHQYTHALYEKGLAIGMATSGLLFDAVTPDGRVIDANKRCWGLTELIKASLVQIREGNPNAEAIAIKGVNDLFTYYLCASTRGSYVDQRGTQDEIVVDFAPASTLYHLIVAAVELIDHCAGVYDN